MEAVCSGFFFLVSEESTLQSKEKREKGREKGEQLRVSEECKSERVTNLFE